MRLCVEFWCPVEVTFEPSCEPPPKHGMQELCASLTFVIHNVTNNQITVTSATYKLLKCERSMGFLTLTVPVTTIDALRHFETG